MEDMGLKSNNIIEEIDSLSNGGNALIKIFIKTNTS